MGEQPLRLRSRGSGLWVARRLAERITSAILFFTLPGLVATQAAPRFHGAALPILLVHVFAWGYMAYLRASVSGTVVVDGTSVRCGLERIERAGIRHGFFVPATAKEPAGVTLLDADERILGRIGVASPEEADRVLTELKLAPHQATASFAGFAPGGSSGANFSVLALIVGVAVVEVALRLRSLFVGLLGIALAVVSQALLASCRYHVGADGILIVDRFARRFVPWRKVEAVEPSRRGIVLRMHGGRTIAMPIVRRTPKETEGSGEQAAFFTRAHEAFGAFQRGETPDVAGRVARGGRTRQAWLAALAAETGEGGFRIAPLAPDQLLRVVESAATNDSARAGAAFVLGRTGSDEDRARLRVAAEACASPRLRVVLEKAAAASPPAELEEAIGVLEDDDERSVAGLS